MDQSKNIQIVFTEKAENALSDLMVNFKLEETDAEYIEKTKNKKPSNIVVLDNLAKDFALGVASEKDIIISLQNIVGVSQQNANQITKEIINKIVPFLEKVPEEKFQDNNFVDGLEKKVFGVFEEPKNNFSFEKNTIVEKSNTLPKKPVIQTTQKQGPDNYREPIE